MNQYVVQTVHYQLDHQIALYMIFVNAYFILVYFIYSF